MESQQAHTETLNMMLSSLMGFYYHIWNRQDKRRNRPMFRQIIPRLHIRRSDPVGEWHTSAHNSFQMSKNHVSLVRKINSCPGLGPKCSTIRWLSCTIEPKRRVAILRVFSSLFLLFFFFFFVNVHLDSLCAITVAVECLRKEAACSEGRHDALLVIKIWKAKDIHIFW